jgi:hypothetical protein
MITKYDDQFKINLILKDKIEKKTKKTTKRPSQALGPWASPHAWAIINFFFFLKEQMTYHSPFIFFFKKIRNKRHARH